MTKLCEPTHEKVVQALLECSQHERGGGGRMSLVRVFARCNSGHYFMGLSCPFDGWSSDETRDVARAASRLAERGTRPSFDALVGEELSAPALARACVAEFPAEAAPEAIEPQTIVVAGRALPLHKAPPSFH